MPTKPARARDLPFDVRSAIYVLADQTGGAATAWEASQDGDSWALTRWTRDAQADWTAHDADQRYDSWLGALSSDPAVLDFPFETDRVIGLPEVEPLLDLLSSNGAAARTVAENDGTWDVFYCDNVIPMGATINGAELVAAQTGEVAAAFRAPESDEINGETIASFLTGTEMGGGGAGGWQLVHSSSARVIAVPTGDTAEWENEVTVFPIDGTPEGFANMLIDWVRLVEDTHLVAIGAAALELEPLDPNSTLTDDERAEWADALDALAHDEYESISMTIRATPEVKDLVRSGLAQDQVYADIREALRAPAENRWLIDGLYDGVLFQGRPGSR